MTRRRRALERLEASLRAGHGVLLAHPVAQHQATEAVLGGPADVSAGIRHADLTGYMYSREDVTARSLANGYSQSLGTIFSQELKPLEVEILVEQVGESGHANELYRISFDGSIFDERGFAAIGGRAEALQVFLKERYKTDPLTLKAALSLCVATLESGTNQKLPLEGLEVAALDRTRVGRKFRRIPPSESRQLLA